MASAPSDSRTFGRLRWRVPCSFRLDEIDRRGFVTDLSARGLFVHTASPAEPKSTILLTLNADDDSPIVLSGVVVRTRRTNRNARIVDQAGLGMGIQLDSAPEAYYQLVADLTDKNVERE